MKCSVGWMAYVPARMYVSNGFTPAAWIRTTACPGPAFGVGNSSSFITSGAPNSCTTIAFIFVSLAWEIAVVDFVAKANSGDSREQSQLSLGLSGAGFSLWGLVGARSPSLQPKPTG